MIRLEHHGVGFLSADINDRSILARHEPEDDPNRAIYDRVWEILLQREQLDALRVRLPFPIIFTFRKSQPMFRLCLIM